MSSSAVFAASGSDYNKSFKIGKHDEAKEGVYHHDTAESGSKDFSSGYFDGLMKGCKNAGRSEENCNVQTDANTP
jgi:hypothetical protein